MIGRAKPYTCEQMKRARCRCGKRAAHQWSCCSLDHRYVAVCLDCDVALNETVLAFFRVPGRARILARYRRRVRFV